MGKSSAPIRSLAPRNAVLPEGTRWSNRGFQQSDAHGAFGSNIIAEGSRQIDFFDVVDAGAPAIEQDAQAGSDGAFGQLQLAHIRLPNLDGAADRELLGASGEPAAGADDAAVKSGSHRIHQSAAADAARFDFADHGAFHSVVVQEDPRNCSGSGAHAHLDGARFEGAARRSGSAQDFIAIAQRNFSVGAQIDQGAQVVTRMQTHGDDAGQNVGPDKASDAGEEADDCPDPAAANPGLRGEPLLTQVGRGEGHMGERFGIEPAEQMMHYRIADQHHFNDFFFPAGGDIMDHGSEEIANQGGEFVTALREADPAHHIGALNRLRIQAGAQAQQFAR